MATPKLRFKEFDGDWFQSKIGEIFQVTSGSTPLRSDNRFFENADIAWVKTTDLNNGLIEKTEEKISQIALKETSVKILPKGTVFVAMYGGFNQIGRTGLLVHEAACNQALSAIYPNEKIDSYFLLTFLNHKVDDWKNFAASSRKDPNITKSDVLAFPLKYPVKEEQTKIASFLSNVDEKISQLTQKHALLSQYKQGMMQKLFSQQLRFKADDGSEFGEWEKVKLGSLLIKHDEKTEFNNQYPVLTSSRHGIYFQKDYFAGQDVASADTTGYNVVPYDYFTYRHMSDDLVFKFNINTICPKGIVSTLYPVFTVKDEHLNKYFLQTILNEGQEFKNFAIMQKQGGSRTYMYFSKLSELVLTIPCLEEQTKIANFLSAIDQKIEVVTQQIEQAKTWKKGLLQQMFV
ncbi:restriction endonuclease subunit S [Acinetobacter baumannii]|uniref:restriction endonuclease subunit S n=1 Tax=Acinetobacter baumannii TaxID=470 RepID=UPI003B42E205